MLQAFYEIDDTVPASKIVDAQEARGKVRFAIAGDADLPDLIKAMNVEAHRLCHKRGWLQLWDGGVGIVDIRFELTNDLEAGVRIDALEGDRLLKILVDRRLTPAEFAGIMTAVSAKVLAGGQLFQCWEGEIVSNASAEDSPVIP